MLSVSLAAAMLVGACVEQDDEKPNEDDMKVAKQNILTTAPTPKYAVNADLDGKIVYIAKLYNEEFHLLARPNIKTIADLANKTINVDLRGSGIDPGLIMINLSCME